MSQIPSDLRYTASHEWLKLDAPGTATIGITDYAQGALGDITYVQLPKVGTVFKAGEAFGVIESVKAASDVYFPVGGTVTAVNEALAAAPETLNREPYTSGWLLRLQLTSPAEVDALLDAAAYGRAVS